MESTEGYTKTEVNFLGQPVYIPNSIRDHVGLFNEHMKHMAWKADLYDKILCDKVETIKVL